MDMKFWNELLRRADDLDRVDAAVAKGKSGAGKFVVRMDCWNKVEADELLAYGHKKYPDVEFFARWPDFERSWREIQEHQKYNGRF